MPAFKLTMLLNYISGGDDPHQAIRSGGASESLYWDDASDATVASFRRLAQRRAYFLPKYSAVIGIRVQQVDPVGSSQTFDAFYPGSTFSGFEADVPQMGLKIRLKGVGVTNVVTKRLVMIPDAAIVNGEFRGGGGMAAPLRTFLTQLGFWKFRGLDLTKTYKTVTSVAADGTFTVAEDLALAPGNLVGVRGVTTAAGNTVTGEFKVDTATSLRVFKVLRWTHGTATGGKARQNVYIYPVMQVPASGLPFVPVVRKIGRPFNLYRGRASRRS